MRISLFLIAFVFANQAFAQAPKLMIPKGHTDDIKVLAESPDKKWFASGDEKGTVKLWDMQLAREIVTFDNNPALSNIKNATALAFSPDSKKLFTGIGYSLVINDLLNSGKEIFNKKIHENKITQILFSSNGKTLVTSADGEIKIWDADNLTTPKVVAVKGKQPKLAFDNANNIVVITTGNFTMMNDSYELTEINTNKGYITHVNISTGQILTTDEFENLKDDHLYISNDGKLVAITRYEESTGTTRLLDTESKKIIKKFDGIQDSSITLLSFSNNNRYMITKAGTSIMLYDVKALKYVKTFYSDDIFSSSFLFGPDDTKLFQGINSNGSIVEWNIDQSRVERVFGTQANAIKDLAIIPGSKSLSIMSGESYFRGNKTFLQKLDFKNPVLSKLELPGIKNSLQKINISSAGGGKILEDKIASLIEPILSNNMVSSFAISNNNRILVTTNQYESQPQLNFFNLADGKKTNNFSLKQSAYTLLFSKDDQFVYVGYEGNNKVDKIDIKNGTVLKTFEHINDYSKSRKITQLLLSKDETTLIGVNDFRNMHSWNTATGVENKLNIGQSGMGFSLQSIPNTNTFVYGDGGNNIEVYDLTTNKIIRSLKCDSRTIGDLDITPDGKFLFYNNNDKSVSIWDLTKGELLVTMVFFGEKDWVIVDKAGRFEGTQEGMKKMYYVKGLESIALESSFEKFFTPGLLTTVMNGDKMDPTPIDIHTLKAAPIVKIAYSESARNLVVEDDSPEFKTTNGVAKIEVNASCPADAVTEIRLYLNGKLVGGTRNLVVEDEVKASPKMSKTFTVNLLPGANTFKAIALNTQRTESKPMDILVNYTAPQNDVPLTSNITLHMLVVGINKYKNPKYDLNYAKADAEAFRDKIIGGSKSLFAASEITYLSNDQASQSGITAAFEKIKNSAKPQDLFIFYYAGHGVINDKKEFFLVPFDVTQLYGNDAALAQKGFSAATLQQLSKDIKAQKQLFILDACQSAGALSQVAGSRGAAEEKAIAQLARSTGTQWLTASGSEQFAAEFDDLGHGSFTYCILQALGGAANTGNQLTVKQLDAYLQTKVPEVTEKYKGTPQYPASYSYGNDFPIYIFK